MSPAILFIHAKQEFRTRNFGFGDVHPGRFSMFQWRTPPWLYLVYRIVLAVYVDVWLVYTADSMIGYPGDMVLYSWPVYLTNWTYLMLALYLTWHAVGTLIFLCTGPVSIGQSPSREMHKNMFMELQTYPSLWGGNDYETINGKDEEQPVNIRLHQLPWYFKITWVLYNVVSSAAVMVTAVFFIFLWPMLNQGGGIDMMNLQLHGINSVIIIIEHLLSAVPVRLYHCVFPLIYGLLYVLFSVIFWAVDHSHVIYPKVLDWNKPGPTILMVAVLAVVVLPLLQLLYFLFYKLKIYIYKRVVLSDGEFEEP